MKGKALLRRDHFKIDWLTKSLGENTYFKAKVPTLFTFVQILLSTINLCHCISLQSLFHHVVPTWWLNYLRRQLVCNFFLLFTIIRFFVSLFYILLFHRCKKVVIFSLNQASLSSRSSSITVGKVWHKSLIIQIDQIVQKLLWLIWLSLLDQKDSLPWPFALKRLDYKILFLSSFRKRDTAVDWSVIIPCDAEHRQQYQPAVCLSTKPHISVPPWA